MKKTTLYMMFSLFVSAGLAYTYEVYTYGDNKTLYDEETILIDLQGGMDGLTLYGDSTATIQGTSILNQGFGGIWTLHQYDSSSLVFEDGELGKLITNSNATAILKGGLIEEILSYQWVPYTGGHGEPSMPIPNIKLYYSGDLPTYNESTDILTGLWGNGDPFNIHLHDVSGYDPVIDNIDFILVPEPITLLLFGFGSLLIRSKKR